MDLHNFSMTVWTLSLCMNTSRLRSWPGDEDWWAEPWAPTPPYVGWTAESSGPDRKHRHRTSVRRKTQREIDRVNKSRQEQNKRVAYHFRPLNRYFLNVNFKSLFTKLCDLSLKLPVLVYDTFCHLPEPTTGHSQSTHTRCLSSCEEAREKARALNFSPKLSFSMRIPVIIDDRDVLFSYDGRLTAVGECGHLEQLQTLFTSDMVRQDVVQTNYSLALPGPKA